MESRIFKEVQQTKEAFATSTPYLHAVLQDLVQPELLKKVRQEVLSQLHYTEKETDIYRVLQTGDLANLTHLPKEELAKLQHLFTLRNALYSQDFRDYLSTVTGCGPLSGEKMDMSINNYVQGCHLLNHDDVIGTRRVSFILYLPDPEEPWQPEYGGALELYPVVKKGVPANVPSKTIPPKWNQFVFFTVQPGHSFHSVEEVVVPHKGRLSISGWFHLPLPHEQGYAESMAICESEGFLTSQASLQQLEAGAEVEYTTYDSITDPLEVDLILSSEDVQYLKKYINEDYLTAKSYRRIAQTFIEDSLIQMDSFLRPELASKIKKMIQRQDLADGFSPFVMSAHDSCQNDSWVIQGPPHKQRFMTLAADAQHAGLAKEIAELQILFTSSPFKKLLTTLTTLTLVSYNVKARRFRPGLDYTLAASHPVESILDVTLNLSPGGMWQNTRLGGWECYMPGAEDDEHDPAVYAGGKEEEEEDGPLLTAEPAWNRLQIVLRDAGVLHFVKYISAGADESRWDIRAEYEYIDIPSDDESDEEEEEEEMEEDAKRVEDIGR